MQAGSTLQTVTASVLTPAEETFVLEKVWEKKGAEDKENRESFFSP